MSPAYGKRKEPLFRALVADRVLLLLAVYILQYSEVEFHGAYKPLNPFHFQSPFFCVSSISMFIVSIIQIVNLARGKSPCELRPF